MISIMNSLLVLLLLPLIIIFLSYFTFHKNKTKEKLRLPPGPQAFPLLGNINLLIHASSPHLYLQQLSKKYGPLMSLRLGSVPILVVSSANMAKEIINSTNEVLFPHRPSFVGSKKFSYNGLDIAFAPYNSHWREMKKIRMVNLFNSTKVKTFRPIRESEISNFVEKIAKLASKSEVMNLSDSVLSLTKTIICKIVFGKSCEESEGHRLQELLREINSALVRFFFADNFPMLGFIDKFTGLTNRLENSFKEFNLFLENIIQQHVNVVYLKPDEQQHNVLDALLEIQKDCSCTKLHLTSNHIKAVLMNVLTGGIGTTGTAVILTMTYLIKNPTTMKKAQEEVRSVFGKKSLINEDDVEKLSYLKAVVIETMRMQPPIPIFPRESSQACNINGYKISAKTLVNINAYAAGRDPRVWENAEEFCPERFIENSMHFKRKNSELVSFGGGRRSFPGLFMGLVSIELILANLLHKFDWELPAGINKDDVDLDVQTGLTGHKKSALCLVPINYV